MESVTFDVRLEPAEARDIVKTAFYKRGLDLKWRDERHGTAGLQLFRGLTYRGIFGGEYRIGVSVTPHDGGCTIRIDPDDFTVLGQRTMGRKLRLLDSDLRTTFERAGVLTNPAP